MKMNRREYVLKEALQENEEEFKRWQGYLKENENAIENMTMFGKRLTADVMVPVGKKAFMPGHLLHTNEVLVSHYQGYFSKCTNFKAREICALRIKMATEHIKKLEIEANLWHNKLLKPYAEGVIPNDDEHEIIEEYNEETEKLWNENHRIHVKEAKQNEREEREKWHKQNCEGNNALKGKTNENILKMMEEAELMEDLEHELDSLKVDEINDETIRKLISGEMKLPQEKKRLSHGKSRTEEKNSEVNPIRRNIVKLGAIQKSTEISTNNNIQPNLEIVDFANLQEEEDEEKLPEEVSLIKEQAKYLCIEEQIGFYDYQIQIIKKKLKLLPLRTQRELNEKLYLLNVLEHLEELLEVAEESLGETELDEIVEHEDQTGMVENDEELPDIKVENLDLLNNFGVSKNRRISFALQDQTLEFRNNEAVTQMLPKIIETPHPDVIKSNDNIDEQQDKLKINSEKSLRRLDLIQANVEKNLQFVEENQSKKEFDLVQHIIQSSKRDRNTLRIEFKHSHQEGYKYKSLSNTPESPADIYNFYTKSLFPENSKEPSIIFCNSYEGEEQVKVPILKETDRPAVFADPKSKFSNPLQAKSILKNKSAVDEENHYENKQHDSGNRKPKNKSSKKGEEDYLSVYAKVMNDVTERSITEPEPLPDVKFIDAHTPKKRISRFKQMRNVNKKT